MRWPPSAAVCSLHPQPHTWCPGFSFCVLSGPGQGLFGLQTVPSSKWLLAQTIEPFFAGTIVDTGDVSGIAANPDQVLELLKAPTRYRVLSPFEVNFG